MIDFPTQIKCWITFKLNNDYLRYNFVKMNSYDKYSLVDVVPFTMIVAKYWTLQY